MEHHPGPKTRPPGLEGYRRKAIAFDPKERVKTAFLKDEQPAPLIMHPAHRDVDLLDWAATNRETISSALLRYGAILFRGFGLESADHFQSFAKIVSGGLLPYSERSSPRTQVSGNVYTSTDYPPDQSIFLHNENSYQRSWPMKIFFFCHAPAAQGGETPIADVRRIFMAIDPSVRERFARKGVLYVRTFGQGLGLAWQDVFQVADKQGLEDYCSKAGIDYEWTTDGRFITKHVGPAALSHPVTGEPVWFNHATFFHLSTLDESTRNALLSSFRPEELPYNTYYGDGTPIESEVLDHLRTVYRSETVTFPWQKGDLLMLDNMMFAHGRAPFVPPRKILVAMTELYRPS